MNKKIFLLLIVLLVFYGQTQSQPGVSKKRPLAYEHGSVVINNYSDKADLAPVVFEHWIHRSKFNCRVCHVDVGFAMKAGAPASPPPTMPAASTAARAITES